MVELACPQEAETENVKKFACRKCRTVLFTENDLQDHSSTAKQFKPRDNKVSESIVQSAQLCDGVLREAEQEELSARAGSWA